MLSPDEFSLAQRFASNLTDLGELTKYNPGAAERIRGQLVSHLRSAWPEPVCALGVLPAPGEITRDARGQQS